MSRQRLSTDNALYRVTKPPSYEGGKPDVRVCSLHSLRMQVANHRANMDYWRKYGQESEYSYARKKPAPPFIKVERAPLGDWEDVTEQFTYPTE